jgi:hypothetical protein
MSIREARDIGYECDAVQPGKKYERLEEMCCLLLQGRRMHYSLNTGAEGFSEKQLTFYHTKRSSN